MKFDIKVVWNFLKENGKVYTVRSFLMRDKFVEIEGIGKCWRKKIKQIYFESDLFEYGYCSGFGGICSWWQTIEKFCKGKPKYLYLVVKVE